VFKGAFKNLNKINQLHTTSVNIVKKQYEEQVMGKKSDDKNGENGGTLPINREVNLNDNSPISFRSHYETVQNVTDKSNNSPFQYTQKRIEEIINRMNKNESLDREDSKRHSFDKADNKGSEKMKGNAKKFSPNKDERFLRILKDSFEEADEECENYNRSHSLNRLDKRDKSLKTSNKNVQSVSDVQCTLSKIEKGVAIFVSRDHCIFTLPANFLPSDVKCGNIYELSMKEILKETKLFSDVQKIQEKFNR